MNKNILVIAPLLPRHDQASGDLRFFSLMEILCLSHKVTYIPNSIESDDLKYLDDLKEIGVSVVPFKKYRSIIMLKRFDVAILEFYPMASFFCPKLRLMQPDCLIVADSVDVHFVRLKKKAELFRDHEMESEYEKTRRDELIAYEKSDLVITVTSDDKQALVDAGITSPIRILPNIHVVNPGPVTLEKRSLIFVGGFSHEPNVDAMLYFVKDIFPLIKSRIKNVRLYIVGSKPPQKILELQSHDIIVTGYVKSTTPYLRKSYISVAPLRFGAGMKGKIGEAMAHGIPVVTTSVGAQGMGLIDSHNIMIADGPGKYADAIVKLIEDDGLYATIRTNGLNHIRDHYSKAALQPLVASIFNETYPLKKYSLYEKIRYILKYIEKNIKSHVNHM